MIARMAVGPGNCREAIRSRLVKAANRHGGDFADDARGENTRFKARKSMLAGVSFEPSPSVEREVFVPGTGSSIPGNELKGIIIAYSRLTKSDRSIFNDSPMKAEKKRTS